ncbi:MAG: hypothetical protein WBW84_23345 [Acidobacteriaceae bacterium]
MPLDIAWQKMFLRPVLWGPFLIPVPAYFRTSGYDGIIVHMTAGIPQAAFLSGRIFKPPGMNRLQVAGDRLKRVRFGCEGSARKIFFASVHV